MQRDSGTRSLRCLDADLADAGFNTYYDCGWSRRDAGVRPLMGKIPDAGSQLLPFGFPLWGTAKEQLASDWPQFQVPGCVDFCDENKWDHFVEVRFGRAWFYNASFTFPDGGMESVSYLLPGELFRNLPPGAEDVDGFLRSRFGRPLKSTPCARLWRVPQAWIVHRLWSLRFTDPRAAEPRLDTCHSSEHLPELFRDAQP
jgi:hypothetical protein